LIGDIHKKVGMKGRVKIVKYLSSHPPKRYEKLYRLL